MPEDVYRIDGQRRRIDVLAIEHRSDVWVGQPDVNRPSSRERSTIAIRTVESLQP